MSVPAGHIGRSEQYRIADLIVDVGRQRVTRGDAEVALPKLSFDLLLALIRAAPNLLSQDALMAAVWPGLVVSPETVSQRIKLLRDGLGDDPREPRYVAGLRGRGYRLVPAVEPISSQAPIPATAPGATPTSQPASELDVAPVPTDKPREEAWSTRRRLFIGALTALAVAAIAGIVVGVLRWQRSSPPAPSAVTVIGLPARTVAVLPFDSLSEAKADEFVATGIAESVLHRLAGIRDLTLIAQTSSFVFRGTRADAREIGTKLNARYLVEGSVHRSGERLRVTSQLVDAATGANVWSLRFDRTIGDVFAVEDEISQNVARALEVSLTQSAHPFARFGTEAYLEYLQGQQIIKTRPADAERATEHFSRAIEIAPDFAAAYVALAGAYYWARWGQTENEENLRKVKELLAKALELDPSLGEAYILRAGLKQDAGEEAGAEADYRKGLALSPSSGEGRAAFAEFLAGHGRVEEAIAEVDKARFIDPLTPRSHYLKGVFLLFDAKTGEFSPEAEALFLHTLELAPDYHQALAQLSVIRWSQGRFAEAVALAERTVAIRPRNSFWRSGPVEYYLELEDPGAARALLAAPAEPRYAVTPVQWVSLCLYEGKAERARALLRSDSELPDWDIAVYVVRDAALASRDVARGLRELRAQHTGSAADDPFPAAYRTAMLAQLTRVKGEAAEAERLARKTLELVGERHNLAYPKAIALSLLGQKSAAIDALEEAYARGERRRWWYAFDREPAFEALRRDPRFQSLAAQAHAYAKAQRKLLEEMRQRGDVPVRAAVPSSAVTC